MEAKDSGRECVGCVEGNPWRMWVLYRCEALRISIETDTILGTSLGFDVGITAFEVESGLTSLRSRLNRRLAVQTGIGL